MADRTKAANKKRAKFWRYHCDSLLASNKRKSDSKLQNKIFHFPQNNSNGYIYGESVRIYFQ